MASEPLHVHGVSVAAHPNGPHSLVTLDVFPDGKKRRSGLVKHIGPVGEFLALVAAALDQRPGPIVVEFGGGGAYLAETIRTRFPNARVEQIPFRKGDAEAAEAFWLANQYSP